MKSYQTVEDLFNTKHLKIGFVQNNLVENKEMQPNIFT